MRALGSVMLLFLAVKMPESAVEWASDTSGYDAGHVWLLGRAALVCTAVMVTVSGLFAK